MTREIRPIYTLAPKAYDMAQRQSIDAERYAVALEKPLPKANRGGILFWGILIGTAVLLMLMSPE